MSEQHHHDANGLLHQLTRSPFHSFVDVGNFGQDPAYISSVQ